MAAEVADVLAGAADGHPWGMSVVVEVGRRVAAGTPQRVRNRGLKLPTQTAAGLQWEALRVRILLRDRIPARDLAAADLVPRVVVGRMSRDQEQELVARA